MLAVRKLVSLSLGCWALFPVTGCQKEEGASSQGVVETAGAWKGRELKVCFAEGPQAQAMADALYAGIGIRFLVKPAGFSATQKEFIKDALNAAFTLEAAGVKFGGYAACPMSADQKTMDFQVVFFNPQIPESGVVNVASGVGQSRSVESSKGEFGFIRDEKVKTIGVAMELDRFCGNTTPPFLWKVTTEECSRGVILHEVGHVLGLRHEQAHPDASKDPVCQLDYMTGASPTDGMVSDVLEPLGTSAEVSTYDPRSIMNYCHLMAYLRGDSRGRIHKAELSEGDKATLKFVYAQAPRPASSRPLSCDRKAFALCARNQGGEACVAKHCGSRGDLSCGQVASLKACLRSSEGAACLAPEKGFCSPGI